MDSQTKRNQLKRTFEAFNDDSPKTMLQVARETGIMRASICRYVATLRKSNKIALVKEDYCPLTSHKAQFFTTKPEKVKKIHNQKELVGV
jgi:hypothetical protein